MGNFFTNEKSSIIDEQVNEHCIFIYSTTVCSFCTKTKQLLDEISAEYGVVELNTLSPSLGGQIFNQLYQRTHINTVSYFLTFLTLYLFMC